MANGHLKEKETNAKRPSQATQQSSDSATQHAIDLYLSRAPFYGQQPLEQLCWVESPASSKTIATLLWLSQRAGNQSITDSHAPPKESTGQQLIRNALADPKTRQELMNRVRSRQDVSGSVLEKITDLHFDPTHGGGLQGEAGAKFLPPGTKVTQAEYVSGDLIRDPRGKLAADGLVLGPADETGVRNILSHFEAKAGEASASGLHIGKGESDKETKQANRMERIQDIYSDMRDARDGRPREYAKDKSWPPAMEKRVKGKTNQQLRDIAKRVVNDPNALQKLGVHYTEAESGGQFSSANERMREFGSIRLYKTPPRTEADVHNPANFKLVKVRYNNKTVRVAVTPSDVATTATIENMKGRGWPTVSWQPEVTSEELKIEQRKLQHQAGIVAPAPAVSANAGSLESGAKAPSVRVNLIDRPGATLPAGLSVESTVKRVGESSLPARGPLKAYTSVPQGDPGAVHGQSLRAARWGAGANAAVLGLEALNWGIHKVAAAKREEIVTAELAKLDPILAKRMADNPELGARVVIVYDRIEAAPESPLQPPETFARLEWSLGRNEREAFQLWRDEPKLRPGLVHGEQEITEVRWHPPSKPVADVPMPEMPFPATGLATFAPGKASLLQVAIRANGGFDDEQDFDIRVPQGKTPRFHILKLPQRFVIAISRPEGLDSKELRTPLADRPSASGTPVPVVDLDPMMPFSDASAVCVFPADEFTLELCQQEGPRTLGNPNFYPEFQHVFWVRPENLLPLK